jgi:pectate lyase
MTRRRTVSLDGWTTAFVAAAAMATLGRAECSRPDDVAASETEPVVAGEVSGGSVAVEDSAIPVFPGAEGFGTRTRAGRGGKVVTVTSLADDGPGTLRDALNDAAPKTIVFGVGGVIRLKSHLFISHPFVTIAGQTAPGDGILIRDFGLVIVTNDVLIQSIRVRPGNEGAVRPDHNDAIAILGRQSGSSGARNVVVDHVSVSWGEDELISTWFGPSDITVSWSIIGEGLNRSRHEKGTHSAGLIVADKSDHVSVHHNLFAHNDFRNPLVMSGGSHDVVNNVVYDWGALPTEIVDDAPMSVNVVGNYYRSGPSTKTDHVIFINGDTSRIVPKIFAAGNMRHGAAAPDNGWSLVQYGWKGTGAPDRYRADARFALPAITTQSAADAFSLVLDRAGAMWPKRDAVDARLVSDVRRGTGAIIDSPREVGGFPAYATSRGPADADGDGLPDEWERREGLDPNGAADGNGDRDGDGYTNLEAYLHALMRAP